MKDVSHYLITNKNMMWSMSICLLAIILSIFILNSLLGLIVHFFDPEQAVMWHVFSPYLILLLLLVMGGSVAYERYVFRSGGHTLAKQLKARRLNLIESTPEESVAIHLNEHLAQKFMINPPTLYVLPDEIGVNALTAGFHPQDIVIVLTWGALQNLDELELYGLLSHEFNQILSGETAENTRLKIVYSSLTTFSQWGSKIAKLGFRKTTINKRHQFETTFVAIGGIIWLVGSLGVLVTRLIKYLTLGGRTFRNDFKTKRLIQNDANIQTLLRIYVHHAGSQIHSEYSESIAHMCFANSLSPQSWMNIHPNIEERIYELNPALLQDLQLENLKKLRSQPFFSLFRSLEEINGEVYNPWTSPQPLPLLRLSPISFAINDAIKPLKPEIRRGMKRPELIQRAMLTATGSREVMVAILMIRQYREFIPKEAEVSRAIVDALLNLDGRVHIQIFLEACKNIGHMPASIARQFLTRLAKIIQEDGEIGLLDALLLEKVKYELNLMPLHMPVSLEDAKPQIVRLVDALLHVQQINSPNQLDVRYKILQQVLTLDELSLYEEISDEPLDLAEILNDIAGLLLRDRLSMLGIAELCLWHDRIITQDELDVLELLYWRLGFETREIIDQMQKKNSVMII
ncbi:M48 family metalloprotease [Acinetobacter radioresistens]|uniref:Peptidase M48 n=1 Tax=Acinetobacter radioresistens TaxID=40216 RepID=A0A3D3G3E4_ACIRA|nr:M48 family metalloprotease [Acinetobacter radioresistens]EJO37379.1 peptidase, M48 domain protein [Acinetobacter radioresistens WC-A-157]MCK4086173.1 M48 family metalloprotease [Acinetobacter radioresistens]MCX0330172.1 M48 family metalloprotease [Acinetobacter radioresistens]MCX0333086.1 M48 family metalloprotease [Acinetobacter radioresistens]HCM32194.1 peptidase M48 [Acinetobacter radioresistens]